MFLRRIVSSARDFSESCKFEFDLRSSPLLVIPAKSFTTAKLVKPESSAFALSLLRLLVIPAKAGIQ
jgi:hypothetical protein